MAEQQPASRDFYQPLEDRNKEVLARSLAQLLAEERPLADIEDLLFAARKIVTDTDDAE